jgi:formate dehydrogenase major subunit
MEAQSSAGQRDALYEDFAQGSEPSEVTESGRGESHGSGGAPLRGTPRRDDTMEHPRCVFQVLKRHFSR